METAHGTIRRAGEVGEETEIPRNVSSPYRIVPQTHKSTHTVWKGFPMRSLVIVVLLMAPCFAQDEATFQRNSPSGHTLSAFDDNTPQITVEVRFITAPENAYRKLMSEALIRCAPGHDKLTVPTVPDEELSTSGGIRLVSATTVVEENRPVFVETVNEATTKQLIQQVQSNTHSNVMFAPKVTLFDGQLAVIKDTTSRPFVTGLTAKGDDLSPDIQTIEEGTQLAIRTRVRDDKSVRMDIGTRLSQLRNVSVANAGRKEAKVQVPKVHRSDIQLSAIVPEGETIAIWGFQTERSQRVTKPAFNGIPYLSRAFTNTARATETQHMLLLITPAVLDLSNATD